MRGGYYFLLMACSLLFQESNAQLRLGRFVLAGGGSGTSTIGQPLIGVSTQGQKSVKAGFWYQPGVTPAIDLTLASICSETPDKRRWRITNPGGVPVNVTWEVYPNQHGGSLVALPGETFFSTPESEGANTLKIYWQVSSTAQRSQTKASSNEFCFPSCVSAVSVESFIQGKRKDNQRIAANRSDASQALSAANANDTEGTSIKFVSLGFGGTLVLKLDNPLVDRPGPDLRVTETSYGNPSFRDYPEQADVFVSKDGTVWSYIGKTNAVNPSIQCNQKLDSDLDLNGILNWCRYVKLVDITDKMAKKRNANCSQNQTVAFNGAADGFDVDAVTCLIQGIGSRTNASARTIPEHESIDQANVAVELSEAAAYPNPAGNFVTIDFNNEAEFVLPEDGKIAVQIFSGRGDVLGQTMAMIHDDFTITIALDGYPSGLLLVKIMNAGLLRVAKVVKK